MATPLSADTLLAALRAEGVRVVEQDGWRTHNRNRIGPWGPANGVMVHHTVTSGTDATVRLCRDGYTDLPGPLCHGVIDKAGVVHLVGWGRANHAGRGDPAVHRAVVAESYGTRPPLPAEDTVDGNAHYYGFEAINLGDGRDPWPEAQLDAIARASAAICRAHGWTDKSVIGHLEWTRRKIDPRGFTMPEMRARVRSRLAGPATSTTSKEVADVAISDEDTDKIARHVWLRDGIIRNINPATREGNPYVAGTTVLQNLEILARRTERRLVAQAAAIEQLAAALAAHHVEVDAEQLVARIREAIEGVTVRLDVDGGDDA